MDKRALREALDAYATRRLPPPPDLWTAVRKQAQAQQRPILGRSRRVLISSANALAAVTLLAIVALVLAFVLSGMNGRRNGGALGPIPSATPTPATPPGQPFPVPADCPVTPLHGPEERDGFTAYWLDNNGHSLGIASGLFYEGVSIVRSTDLTDITGQHGDKPPVLLPHAGLREGWGIGWVEFPGPGCWTIRGHAFWLGGATQFTVTIYVYPGLCPRRVAIDNAPPASPSPCLPSSGTP